MRQVWIGEVRNKIDTFKGARGIRFGARKGRDGAEDIKRRDGMRKGGSGGEHSFPLKHEGNPVPTLSGIALISAQCVITGGVDARWTTIVGKKKDEGVFFDPVLTQGLEDTTDAVIHRTDHSGVGAALTILDPFEPGKVAFCGLQRAVRSVISKKKKKRLLVASPIEPDIGITEVVGHDDDQIGAWGVRRRQRRGKGREYSTEKQTMLVHGLDERASTW
jgi:hypothetical protein